MGETLDQRVEKAADDARRAWLSTADTIAPWEVVNDADKADWRNVVRPHVERIVKLEIDAARETELAKLDGAEMAEMRDKLTAAQTSGRDQASEIERLRSEIEYERRARVEMRDVLTAAQAGMSKETKRADDADDEIERLTTTIDVLAGRLAARGQS